MSDEGAIVSTSDLPSVGDVDEDDITFVNERDERAEAAAMEKQLAAKKHKRLKRMEEVEVEEKNPLFKRGGDDEDDAIDDFIVDDIGAHDMDDDFGVKRDKKMMEAINLQPGFQPSSSPLDNRRRWLCWNSVGSIMLRQESDEVNAIEIVFADTTKHKATRFRDYYNFKYAALGKHGSVFACKQSYDKKERRDLPSTIFFRPTDSWDAQQAAEWSLALDPRDKEEVEGVAVGDTWVAAATNKQYVRIMSHSGIQKFILSMSGPLVCMTGWGNLLCLVIHAGIPLPGHQSLKCMILDVSSNTWSYDGLLPLSPRSILTWCAFTDNGNLTTMDSHGVMRCLAVNWKYMWTPILDTNLLKKAGSTDVYWPVSIQDDKLVCVICKGGARSPNTVPRPIPTSVPIQLPFMDLQNDNKLAMMEENYCRYDLLWFNSVDAANPYTPKQQVHQDKLLLNLFQKSCKSDRNSRALDLCTMLKKRKSMEMAITIANHEKKPALVTRLTMLMQVKFPPKKEKAAPSNSGSASSSNRPDEDDEESIRAFLEGDEPASKKARLVKPKSRWDEENDEEQAVIDSDEGEAELSFSNKPQENDSPNTNPFFVGSSLKSSQVKSANVKDKKNEKNTEIKKSNPFAKSDSPSKQTKSVFSQ